MSERDATTSYGVPEPLKTSPNGPPRTASGAGRRHAAFAPRAAGSLRAAALTSAILSAAAFGVGCAGPLRTTASDGAAPAVSAEASAHARLYGAIDRARRAAELDRALWAAQRSEEVDRVTVSTVSLLDALLNAVPSTRAPVADALPAARDWLRIVDDAAARIGEWPSVPVEVLLSLTQHGRLVDAVEALLDGVAAGDVAAADAAWEEVAVAHAAWRRALKDLRDASAADPAAYWQESRRAAPDATPSAAGVVGEPTEAIATRRRAERRAAWPGATHGRGARWVDRAHRRGLEPPLE